MMLKINELFKRAPVSWTWTRTSPGWAEANFAIAGINYTFDAKNENPDDRDEWDLEFSVVGGNDSEQRYSITGTGNAALVMSTIVSITREFLKKYPDVTKLTFSATEQSRNSLYSKMVHRLLPDWKMIKDEESGSFKLIHPSAIFSEE